MEVYRQCVFPKDVERILGRTIWTARRILQRIRKQAGKKSDQFVTADEFAMHTGIPVDLVMRYISDGKWDKPAYNHSANRPAKERPLHLPHTNRYEDEERIEGPSRDNSKTDPEASAIRKAVESFKHAVHAADHIFTDVPYDRLARLFTSMMGDDKRNVIRPRSLFIARNRPGLMYIELDAKKSFLSAFAATVSTEHNHARTAATVHLKDIQVTETLFASPSPSATHFKLFHLLGSINDIIYDPTSQSYRFSDLSFHNTSALSESEHIPLSADPLDITLHTRLPDKITPRQDTTIIQALGLVYYSCWNGKSFNHRKGKAMQIINAF